MNKETKTTRDVLFIVSKISQSVSLSRLLSVAARRSSSSALLIVCSFALRRLFVCVRACAKWLFLALCVASPIFAQQFSSGWTVVCFWFFVCFRKLHATLLRINLKCASHCMILFLTLSHLDPRTALLTNTI